MKKSKKLWKGKQTVRENLQERYPDQAREYFEAGAEALREGTTWEEKHRFRLLTKRFRYSLEILRPAYGPALDRQIEALKDLQTILGDMNDCVVTSAMLERFEGTEEARQRLADRASAKEQKLHKHWQTTFSPERQAALERYLRIYACRKAPPRPRKISAEVPQTV